MSHSGVGRVVGSSCRKQSVKGADAPGEENPSCLSLRRADKSRRKKDWMQTGVHLSLRNTKSQICAGTKTNAYAGNAVGMTRGCEILFYWKSS